VSAGFKCTEVGVIPEDWSVLPLSAIADIRSGGTPSTANPSYWGGGIPWCTPTDITALNGRKYLLSTQRSISDAGLRSSSAELVPASSVIMTSRATIGACAINLLPVTTNQGFKNLVPLGDVSANFLYYLMCTKTEDLIKLCVGSTFLEIGKTELARFNLQVAPLLEERETIAEALSDTDALIESLQQFIAKKRALKQGAMQALLTGRQRLPGFTGEWKSKPLSELFHFSGGFSASRAQLGQDGHLYLHYGDIHGANSSRLDVGAGASRIPRIEIPLARISRDSMLEDGDVVFVDASEDEEGVSRHVVVSNPDGVPFIAGLHTIVAKGAGCELEHAYRRYCFHSEDVRQQFRFFAVGTKVQGVSKGNIGKIELRFPSSDEQTAIATVLSDMDAEIDALETRLAKTRDLKAGMMQALLTGRIRLPLDTAA
jgi:type I restriction enzyme S subunit